MAKLEYIQHDTAETIDACVIWLHGLGADGADFVPIVEQMQLPSDLHCRFIFPHAPVMPITINQGYRMPGWYDIRNADIVTGEDIAGIEASSTAIDQLIASQIKQGIVASRIILAGFSQGGVIALHCGLRRREQAVAGIIALSCYLPQSTEFLAEPAQAILLAHGTEDAVVNIERGRDCYQRLQNAGYAPEWREYAMPHSVCLNEINDIRQWLLQQLKRSA